MEPYGLPTSPHYETAVFTGNFTGSVNLTWQTWTKPVGKAYAHIMLIGGGGGGGTGIIGAANSAGGGGGGGSGGVTILEVPLSFLPPRLYIAVPEARTVFTYSTYVALQPSSAAPAPNHILALANNGGVGGNGSTSAGGIAGNAGNVATAAAMPVGWPFVKSVIGGQPGAVGGAKVAGVDIALPVTGIRVTGGSGGAGLPPSGVGLNGGSFTTPVSPSYFPAQIGGLGASAATTAPGVGNAGFRIDNGPGGHFYYGGTGGGSTHATATGAGLVQAAGGNGGVGSGGGGMGAALTGSAAAVQSMGGAGLVVITCY